MVWLNRVLLYATKPKKPLRAYKKTGFLDSIRIYVKAGAGGHGLPKFGGIGGQGGNVVMIADENLSLNDVVKQHKTKRLVAVNGKNSSHNFILGPPGADATMQVPVGVSVYTDEGKNLGELNEAGQQLIVARGGPGGHPKNGFLGVIGQARSVRLDLKLIADIGLVGFPNAGKSTLLKAVSHARPKIASYPFTTIKPNVGQLMYKDLRQISMADLPGLIEGAHMNKGMGHRFLKHVERTKLLLLVVDINGFQLSPQHEHRNCLDTIVLLNKELEMYKKDLIDKPSMVIINKMDSEGAQEKYNQVVDKIRHLDEAIMDYPEEFRPERTLKFDEIVPLVAKQRDDEPKIGASIEYVKDRLRKLLDVHALPDQGKQVDEDVKLKSKLEGELVERARKLV